MTSSAEGSRKVSGLWDIPAVNSYLRRIGAEPRSMCSAVVKESQGRYWLDIAVTRALRLSTIHYAKGREYDAVALIGLRRGSFPHFRANTPEAIEAEKRQFYVGVTRARKLLMYVAEQDNWNNPPSIFLGPAGVNIVQ